MKGYLKQNLFSDKSMFPENYASYILSNAQEGRVVAFIKDRRKYSRSVTLAVTGAVFK